MMRVSFFFIYMVVGYLLKDFDLENVMFKVIVLEVLCYSYKSGKIKLEEIKDNVFSLEDVVIVKVKKYIKRY